MYQRGYRRPTELSLAQVVIRGVRLRRPSSGKASWSNGMPTKTYLNRRCALRFFSCTLGVCAVDVDRPLTRRRWLESSPASSSK